MLYARAPKALRFQCAIPTLLPMDPKATIIRSAKRRRTVALTVEGDGSLRVLAPMKTSVAWIEAFIAERAGWIARRRKAALARPQPQPLADGVHVPFQGVDHELCINRTAPHETCIALALPADVPLKTLADEIETELTLWYKKQARCIIPERVAFWAERLKVRPARVIITAPDKRWGSCSVKNDIRLNWKLIKAAPELLDYVIVHELCHIPHKNHGKRFWKMVTAAMPDAPALRRRLRGFERAD